MKGDKNAVQLAVAESYVTELGEIERIFVRNSVTTECIHGTKCNNGEIWFTGSAVSRDAADSVNKRISNISGRRCGPFFNFLFSFIMLKFVTGAYSGILISNFD